MDDSVYIDILRRHFGYESFRGIQLDIVRCIGAGHDTLGLMPTGGGKSITFQVPALAMDGVCIVVTPLIALMKDQVEHLKARGLKAEAIYSGQSRQEILRILDNAIYGAVKFLYVSPERLSQQLFLAKLYYMKVCFIAVDEAHCISQWGYDFRPSYLRISAIRERCPSAPLLALTATATPDVVEDIQEKLQFGKVCNPDAKVFSMSFRRDNLAYVVRRTEDKDAQLVHILRSVQGSAIVYTRNRANTRDVAQMLQAEGFTATYYHAGLDFAIKDRHQREWQEGRVRVMAATNAFGMGIDKADVRLVVHMDCPDSLEEYFQEAGRAGRDGLRSYAVLLYNKGDRAALMRRAAQAFPPREYLRRVYDQLAYFFELAVDSGEGARYEFDEGLFCQRFRHFPTTLQCALGLLQNAGYLHYDPDPDNNPRVMFCVGREDLYYVSGLSPLENSVLMTLLRYYGSLFSDLTYIDEGFVAEKAGIGERELHVALKSLAQRRLLRYVPRRHVPLITYLCQRVDSGRLRIGRDVYEERRDRLEDRLGAMMRYADEGERCRQRMLLEYFGETDTHDCGHCDVCLSRTFQEKSLAGSE